jgi:hypothetical protein
MLGYDSTSFHVGTVVGNVSLGQCFSQYIGLVSIHQCPTPTTNNIQAYQLKASLTKTLHFYYIIHPVDAVVELLDVSCRQTYTKSINSLASKKN